MQEIQIDDITIEVERKVMRSMRLYIYPPDGRVKLNVPFYVSMATVRAFLQSRWEWILRNREKVRNRPHRIRPEYTDRQKAVYRARLQAVLSDLIEAWCARLGEAPVEWKIRLMRSEWGSCNARKRSLIFNLELARYPVSCIEYVVVHELTHLAVQNHGPEFKNLMTIRLPDWKTRRAALKNPPEP